MRDYWLHIMSFCWLLGGSAGFLGAQDWDLIDVNDRYASQNSDYKSYLELRQKEAEAACESADVAYYEALGRYTNTSWLYTRGKIVDDSLDIWVEACEALESRYDTLSEAYESHLEAYNRMVKKHNIALKKKKRLDVRGQVDTTAWMIGYLTDMAPILETATRMHNEMAANRRAVTALMVRVTDFLVPPKKKDPPKVRSPKPPKPKKEKSQKVFKTKAAKEPKEKKEKAAKVKKEKPPKEPKPKKVKKKKSPKESTGS